MLNITKIELIDTEIMSEKQKTKKLLIQEN